MSFAAAAVAGFAYTLRMSSNFPPPDNFRVPDTKKTIVEQGNSLIQTMWAQRNDNLITVYRTCSEQEAWNTLRTLVAGGQVRTNLRHMAPPEEQVVQQVGNHETWAQPSGGVDRRLLELQRLGLTNNAPVTQREVVEYSYSPTQLGLDGVRIAVQVNVKFTAKGSGLSFEGFGVVVQVGTPLAAVIYDPK